MGKIVLHGDIVFTKNKENFNFFKDSYLISENNIILEVTKTKPFINTDDIFEDYGNNLIIPGMTDLHLHPPQYPNCKIGYSLELLDWLNKYTFPTEFLYKNLDFCKKEYSKFINDLKKTTTTRVCCFSTLHLDGTLYLMKQLENAGFSGFIGKVNMDRNSPDFLIETTENSIKDTIKYIQFACENFKNIKPIITPRFAISCTDKLLKELGEISKEYNLKVQSHLSENKNEISFVKELFPSSNSYLDVYNKSNLLNKDNPTIMAHCVYSDESKNELKLLKETSTYIAHCPESNINLSSGIAPIRKYLDMNLNIGLGSDISGGSTLNMNTAIVYAINSSKMLNVLKNNNMKEITVSEAFYMATKSGGSYFGKVGSFEKGYDLDAVVIDDNEYKEENLDTRIKKFIYSTDKSIIVQKYIKGKKIL